MLQVAAIVVAETNVPEACFRSMVMGHKSLMRVAKRNMLQTKHL